MNYLWYACGDVNQFDFADELENQKLGCVG